LAKLNNDPKKFVGNSFYTGTEVDGFEIVGIGSFSGKSTMMRSTHALSFTALSYRLFFLEMCCYNREVCQVMMNPFKLAYKLQNTNVMQWLSKGPWHRTMSWPKHPMLPMLNKIVNSLTFNKYVQATLQREHPHPLKSSSTYCSITYFHKGKVQNLLSIQLRSCGHLCCNSGNKVDATRVPAVLGSFGPTLSLVVEETLGNYIKDAKGLQCSMRALGRARRLQEDQFERPTRRKAKRLKEAVGPTIEARKTKMLVEIKGSKSGSDVLMMEHLEGTTIQAKLRLHMIQTILNKMINPYKSLIFGGSSMYLHFSRICYSKGKKIVDKKATCGSAFVAWK
jgi:hypothetical protein